MNNDQGAKAKGGCWDSLFNSRIPNGIFKNKKWLVAYITMQLQPWLVPLPEQLARQAVSPRQLVWMVDPSNPRLLSRTSAKSHLWVADPHTKSGGAVIAWRGSDTITASKIPTHGKVIRSKLLLGGVPLGTVGRFLVETKPCEARCLATAPRKLHGRHAGVFAKAPTPSGDNSAVFD
ncbi:hypothetical protein B0F90DRAFT_1669919 [Multifurca ochricompacta]|uniref:Uncharacterized protein n=1 Tax=Multifurca ochricompacta TaxID=376703 RepID=A0AAD4QK16_9AGAM|nr:hypothetical protein B0F90DRAFT_1669919 [Multifurca ochricompacta]